MISCRTTTRALKCSLYEDPAPLGLNYEWEGILENYSFSKIGILSSDGTLLWNKQATGFRKLTRSRSVVVWHHSWKSHREFCLWLLPVVSGSGPVSLWSLRADGPHGLHHSESPPRRPLRLSTHRSHIQPLRPRSTTTTIATTTTITTTSQQQQQR